MMKREGARREAAVTAVTAVKAIWRASAFCHHTATECCK
jgi:hypothetical protein